MRKVELRIDVTAATKLGQPQTVAGTAYLPDRLPSSRTVIVFASPGGGYSRGYFDMHFPGQDHYSEAAYHTSRGIIFVAQDHLGVGDSSIDKMDELRVETIADGADAFVRETLKRLHEGTLDPSFAAVRSPFVVG